MPSPKKPHVRKKAKSVVQPKKRKATPAPKAKQPKAKSPEAVKQARVTLKGAAVQQFIDAAAVTPSVARAVMATEGAVTYDQASELVKDPNVTSAILNVRQSLAAECGITSKRVMEELRHMAFSNMQDYMTVTADGQPLNDFSKLTREQWAAIQEITIEEYVERKAGTVDEYERVKRTKFKLYPKRDSLVDLAKHLGIKGFGNPLTAKVGVKMQSNPDGTFEAAVVMQLGDEELERIAAGIDDGSDDERTE